MYIAYLDEFGHIGPYISRTDQKHKTHPVFGLGGLVLPANQVRCFATYFFKLKNDLLAFEIKKSGQHPARWEKKGAALYTTKNIKKYKVLRGSTFRLLNKIKAIGGYTFYVGRQKRKDVGHHNSKQLFHSVLREAIKRLDQECLATDCQLMIILDQQEDHVMRPEIVQQSAIEMFGGDPRRTLIEPPIQAESHLYQTIQCADWLCGIFGRLSCYKCEPSHWKDFEWAETYFGNRLEMVSKRSGIRSFGGQASRSKVEALAEKYNNKH